MGSEINSTHSQCVKPNFKVYIAELLVDETQMPYEQWFSWVSLGDMCLSHHALLVLACNNSKAICCV